MKMRDDGTGASLISFVADNTTRHPPAQLSKVQRPVGAGGSYYAVPMRVTLILIGALALPLGAYPQAQQRQSLPATPFTLPWSGVAFGPRALPPVQSRTIVPPSNQITLQEWRLATIGVPRGMIRETFSVVGPPPGMDCRMRTIPVDPSIDRGILQDAPQDAEYT